MNAFPFGEVFPISSEAPDFTFGAVRKQNEGVIPKEVWNGVFIVSKVVVIGSVEVDINP